jgi:hypothetical protein
MWNVDAWDKLAPKANLPYLGDSLGSFSVATTEYVVLDTTRLPPSVARFDMDPAPAAGVLYRQSATHIKRVFLSVLADQDLQLFFRHLSILAPANASVAAADWDAVMDHAGSPASPTEVPTSVHPAIFPFHFWGDDHQIVIKTKATPPTKLHLSLRFSGDHALADPSS